MDKCIHCAGQGAGRWSVVLAFSHTVLTRCAPRSASPWHRHTPFAGECRGPSLQARLARCAPRHRAAEVTMQSGSLPSAGLLRVASTHAVRVGTLLRHCPVRAADRVRACCFAKRRALGRAGRCRAVQAFGVYEQAKCILEDVKDGTYIKRCMGTKALAGAWTGSNCCASALTACLTN